MTEINKRIFTSILLFLILFLCIYSQIALTFFLVFCFYQMISEFYFILCKIFKQNKFNTYICMLFILSALSFIIIFVWIAFTGGNHNTKLLFLLIVSITISTDIGGFLFGKIFKGKKSQKLVQKKHILV